MHKKNIIKVKIDRKQKNNTINLKKSVLLEVNLFKKNKELKNE